MAGFFSTFILYLYFKLNNMIQANELRVGNWLLGASREMPEKMTGRIIAGIDECTCNYLPIPLTPEMLEKCGFEKYGNRMRLKSLSIIINNLGWIAKTSQPELCQIRYLHQLQNLYFALTGKELEVSL